MNDVAHLQYMLILNQSHIGREDLLGNGESRYSAKFMFNELYDSIECDTYVPLHQYLAY